VSGVVYIWRCEGCGRLYPPYIHECLVCSIDVVGFLDATSPGSGGPALPPADATTERICVPSGALWSCSHCGPHPDSTANWCAAGCGSDYNRMTSMPKEES
jgi:hypothetical protein